MTSRLSLVERRRASADDRRLLASASVAGAAGKRSRLAPLGPAHCRVAEQAVYDSFATAPKKKSSDKKTSCI